MKLIALPLAALFAASVMSAQSMTAATPAQPADATKPADPKAAPAIPAPPAKPAAPAKKKEEVPKIPGQTISRPDGTFLGLEYAGGQLKLSFYDKKKKAVAPNVTRATASWPNPRNVTGSNRAVLNPEGKSLVGNKPILPPYTYIVRLSLLQGDGDDAQVVENYAVHLGE
jgi:hypothetical protein